MDQAQGLRDWMAQMSERERTKTPEHVSIKFTDEPWIQDGVVMGSKTVVTYLGQSVGIWRRDNLAKEARKIVEDRLAAIHAESQDDGWVSVTERLPEQDGSYLVWAPKSFPKNAMFLAAEFYSDNGTFYDEGHGEHAMPDVTHWRPISPPRSE